MDYQKIWEDMFEYLYDTERHVNQVGSILKYFQKRINNNTFDYEKGLVLVERFILDVYRDFFKTVCNGKLNIRCIPKQIRINMSVAMLDTMIEEINK